jgi:hypothetical protein
MIKAIIIIKLVIIVFLIKSLIGQQYAIKFLSFIYLNIFNNKRFIQNFLFPLRF